MLEEFMSDDCFLIDRNGTRHGPYKTAFTAKKVIDIYDKTLSVEEGDTLVQPLPNGQEFLYTITSVDFDSGFMEFPGFWRLKYQKQGFTAKIPQATSPVYNFHGSNNVQVGDNNIQNIRSAVETLVHGINNAQTTPQEKEQAKGLLRTFLENPTTASVLGAAATGVLALLG
jgi:hypothetical protein